jgi:hypothetical protein
MKDSPSCRPKAGRETNCNPDLDRSLADILTTLLGVELSLRILFDHPTVREMSAEIERLIFVKLDSLSGDEGRHTLDCTAGVNA